MTVIVTRDVAMRFRGFLTSCMLEIAPGVYTAPRLTRAVRERVWTVLTEWFHDSGGTGSLVMTWQDPSMPGGQGVSVLGLPAKDVQELDGVYLCRRVLPAESAL
jgi:CRISPR-associated protein Cas2